MAAVQAAWAAHPPLRAFFADPTQSHAGLSKVANNLLETLKVSALCAKFIETIIHNGRASGIAAIAEAFFAVLAAARGSVTAQIATARPLSAPAQDALKAALLASLAGQGVKEVTLASQTDASLLGGVRVQVGDWLYDGTLKGKLQQLSQQLQA